VFENKSICFKMLVSLLDHGANIDYIINPTEGLTFLMYFCGMKTELGPIQNQLLLESITFLLEHGADRTKKDNRGKNAFDLAEQNPQKEKALFLLRTVKQKYYHKKVALRKRIVKIDLDDTKISTKEKGESDCKCLLF